MVCCQRIRIRDRGLVFLSNPFGPLLGVGRISCLTPALIGIWIDIIHHVTIGLIRCQDGFLIPLILLFGGVGPGRRTPFQDADLHLWIDLFGIRRKLPGWISGHIGLLILCSLGTDLCTGGCIPVIAHLQLDMVHDRTLPAEQILDQLIVSLRMFYLVIHQQVAGGIAGKKSEALKRQTIDTVCPDVISVQMHFTILRLNLLGTDPGGCR